MSTFFDASKFFKDNVGIISAQTDPVSWNLNCGLLALCEVLQQELTQQGREIAALRQQVAELDVRSRR